MKGIMLKWEIKFENYNKLMLKTMLITSFFFMFTVKKYPDDKIIKYKQYNKPRT